MKRLSSRDQHFQHQLEQLLCNTDEPNEEITRRVKSIIDTIKRDGDNALLQYTHEFDGRKVTLDDLEVSPQVLDDCLNEITSEVRVALQEAATRVRHYHEKQRGETWTYHDQDGTILGQQVTALERVGVYVPGGKAAYPSSVIMNVIPAQVAGVPEIIMVVPTPNGVINPVVMAAAAIAGVNRVFSIGGAQAIAALAYGTELIPKVDKIVGPGNIYVATAKRMVFGTVGIDMIAGPSEILIVADGTTDPDWIAMDLCAQAEHDEQASSLLVCTDAEYIQAVLKSIERVLPAMQRAEIIRAALAANGAMILVDDLQEATDIVNHVAPEHVQLSVAKPEALLPMIRHAGAIFMGHFAAESLGDYCAGPNHVLPTARTARFSSPLGVYDFQKRSSIIHCTETSANELAKIASVLARSEGLTAHAQSAEYRIRSTDD